MQNFLPPSLVFGLSVVTLSIFLVFLSGMFPARFRPRTLRGGIGSLVVEISVVVMTVMGVQAGAYAYQSLPTSHVAVAGGLGLLAAPIAFRFARATLAGNASAALTLLAVGLALNGYYWLV